MTEDEKNWHERLVKKAEEETKYFMGTIYPTYTDEQKKALEESTKRFAAFDKERAEYEQKFKEVIYPNYSKKEKTNYWSGHLHRQMRWNGESGIDEYDVFSKSSYEFWKTIEPEIDDLLPDICKNLRLNLYEILDLLKR